MRARGRTLGGVLAAAAGVSFALRGAEVIGVEST